MDYLFLKYRTITIIINNKHEHRHGNKYDSALQNKEPKYFPLSDIHP